MRRRTTSIQGQLTLRLGVLFGIVFLAASIMLFLRTQEGSGEPPVETLNKRIHEIAAALTRDNGGGIRLALPREATNGIDYVVRNKDGRVLLASSDAVAERLGPPPADWDRGDYRDMDGSNREALFGAFARVSSAIGTVIIQVTETDSMISAEARGLLDVMFEDIVPVLLPFVLAMLIIGLVTIRRSLAPLAALAHLAARITPASTQLRLPDIDLPRELQPLVAAVNGALDRLDAGFRHQREFTADAAHELRTPLAILAAHLDSLADRRTTRALREDVDRMSRLVGQLLSVAQLEELAVAPDEIVDLHAIAVDVAASLAPLAVRQGKEIAVIGSSDAVAVSGKADALRQAVYNLVENALEQTPARTAVEIEVTRQPAVHVTDRGPGVPKAQRTQVTERFWRGDRRKGNGAGLGLSIVSRIAAAHGGRLVIDDAPGGGACFSLRLLADA